MLDVPTSWLYFQWQKQVPPPIAYSFIWECWSSVSIMHVNYILTSCCYPAYFFSLLPALLVITLKVKNFFMPLGVGSMIVSYFPPSIWQSDFFVRVPTEVLASAFGSFCFGLLTMRSAVFAIYSILEATASAFRSFCFDLLNLRSAVFAICSILEATDIVIRC